MMPILRFRSVEGMEATIWLERGDPKLYRSIAAVWNFGQQTMQPRYPPGVHKHRSIEDMNRLDEKWEQLQFETFQKRRAAEIERLKSID